MLKKESFLSPHMEWNKPYDESSSLELRKRFPFASSHETDEIYLDTRDSAARERALFHVLSHVPLFHLLWRVAKKEVADVVTCHLRGLNKREPRRILVAVKKMWL